MFEQMLAGLESSPTAVTPARTLRSVAVVGAGPIGQAVACAALAGGCEVSLLSPFRDEATRLGDSEQLTVTGAALTGTYRLGDADAKEPSIRIASGFDAAVAAADAVVLAVPASTHTTYAGMLAPVLRQGQIVVLVPGGCFGALEVSRALRRNRCRARSPWSSSAARRTSSRCPSPGSSTSSRSCSRCPPPRCPTRPPVLPSRHCRRSCRCSAPPSASWRRASPTCPDCSWPRPLCWRPRRRARPPCGIGCPSGSSSRCSRRWTSNVAAPRPPTGCASCPTCVGWLEAGFGTEARDRVHALDEVPALQSMRCPDVGDIAVHDAVETCLVPLASAAAAVGIATPATASLVGIASVLSGLDHARHGRSLGALGLDGLSADDIRRSLHDRESDPMSVTYSDLDSMRDARRAAEDAYAAWQKFRQWSPADIDALVDSLARAVAPEARRLATIAVEETGYGNVDDKELKNLFNTIAVSDWLRTVRTLGVLWRDEVTRVVGIGEPMGVVAAIIPVTNPTATVIFKTLSAIKAGNAVVHAPHPRSRRCCAETTRILAEAAEAQGAPRGLIQCLARGRPRGHRRTDAPSAHRGGHGHRWRGDGPRGLLLRQAHPRRRSGQRPGLRRPHPRRTTSTRSPR